MVKFKCLVAVGCICFIGCTQKNNVATIHYANIYNQSNETINKVFYQKCNHTDDSWNVLISQSIVNNASSNIPLNYDCINLKATSISGKTLATQWNISNHYPFNWFIK